MNSSHSARPGDSCQVNAAFTLIELLIVIAIIALLAAMLLPVLATAKAQALRIQCLNNQKQLVVAWVLYSADNREALALNGGDPSTTSTQAHLWVFGGNHGTPETLTNFQYLVGGNYALFSSVLRAKDVYKCPADRSLWPVGGRLTVELRSYSMNSYLGTPSLNLLSPLQLNTTYYTVYRKSSDLTAPANRFVFADVNPASICTPGFGVDMNLQSFIHLPSSFHRNRGVVSFADSHVESHKWLDPRTTIGLPTGSSGFITHGTPAVGSPDLLWIAERTTSRR